MNKVVTVMFVDDDSDTRAAVCEVLRRTFRVVEMPSAKSAWDALASGAKPDVLVTDLHMSDGETGYWLIAQVKNDSATASLPIVLLSADVHVKDITRALGLAAFVPMPADSDSLTDTINNVLGAA